jgi:phospholipid-binding lipoprotein MlaA
VAAPEAQALVSFDFFQDYSGNADRYLILRDQAVDPYLFFRDLYLQSVQRDADFHR